MALFLGLIFFLAATFTVEGTSDPRERCYDPKDTGLGKAYFVRYYYNRTSNTCEKFVFGGGQANGNNFENKKLCEDLCVNNNGCVTPPVISPICRLPKSPGTGCANIIRHYFNPATGNCEPFCYGGCNGNANNFITKSLCELTCLGCVKAEQIQGHTSIVCHHKKTCSESECNKS